MSWVAAAFALAAWLAAILALLGAWLAVSASRVQLRHHLADHHEPIETDATTLATPIETYRRRRDAPDDGTADDSR